MSPAEKKARFGMLKGVREAAEHPPEEIQAPAPAAPSRKEQDEVQEPFSTTLSRGMKRKLKKASADERRKQYLLIEAALSEYLKKHHPDVE